MFAMGALMEGANGNHLPPSGPGGGSELSHGGVHFLGTLAQSVGLIGPTASAGILLGIMFAVVGPMGWLTWIIGAVALCCVASGIVFLSRRFLTTGGLYPLAGKAAGSLGGYSTAFGAMLWILVAAPAVALVGGLFISNFLALSAIGVAPSTGEIIALAAAATIFCAAVSYRGIQVSVEFLLGAELLTMAAVIALMIITLFSHSGSLVDHSLFSFGGTSASTILKGIVLMVFSMGGFESATVLGQEAADGQRSIPKAVLASVAVAALFLAFCQYVTTLGFIGTGKELADSSNALGDLCEINGIHWFAYLIDFGLVIASLSNLVAILNGGSRMLYTIPRETQWFKSLTKVSPHKTPAVGVAVMLTINIVVVAIVGITNSAPVLTLENLNTLSGYGAVLMYAFTCLAAIHFMFSRRKYVGALICGLGFALLAYAMYTNFHPFPEAPVSTYAYIFFGLSAAAIVGYFFVRARQPMAFTGMSSDLDTIRPAPQAAVEVPDLQSKQYVRPEEGSR
jgi:amino acid transporter